MRALREIIRHKTASAIAGSMLALAVFTPFSNARAKVPVIDDVTNANTGVTALNTTSLETKIVKLDPIATALLKTAIKILKDMVIRWILTGRFEGPVFSVSYSADIRKSAENAARAVLEKLTGIPFCSGISIPSRAFFSFGDDFTLACSFPDLERFRQGQVFSPEMLAQSVKTENSIEDVWVAVLDRQLQAAAIATKSFTAEYQAGQGFLNIKDPRTGKTKTPGRT